MRKFFTLAAAVTAVVFSAKAEVNFAYEAGAEIVSTFIWRGQYNGGLSFQPDASIGFDAKDELIQFRFGAWGNVGASDWKFQKGLPETEDGNPNTFFVPEVDVYGSLTLWGATVGFTHYYYFGGTPFFSGLEDDGGSQTEIQLGYDFGALTDVGIYLNWYTMIAGNDLRRDDAEAAHRAWSTYIELGYDYTWEKIGLTLGGQIGMSPWESEVYGNKKFAVTNISVRLGKEWTFDPCSIELFAQGTLNPDGLTKENVYVDAAGDDKLCTQRLNGAIGFGVWF